MTDTATLLVDGRCLLGEGPFWHPLREELFYFDINNKTLFAVREDGTAAGRWVFPEMAAAGAVIDRDTIAIATEAGVFRLDLKTSERTLLCALEADNPDTRTNDSRVHPSGRWWIGTMAKGEEKADGSVYLYHRGKVERLLSDVKIPNATCFSPDGRIAYFADTPTRRILAVDTDPATGRPVSEWRLFAEVPDGEGWPDGAVVDSEGYLWNARWGGSRVVRYAPDGSVDRVISVPVSQVTCPAFGGSDLKTLFITTAGKNLTEEQTAREKVAGGVFSIRVDVAGQREPLLDEPAS